VKSLYDIYKQVLSLLSGNSREIAAIAMKLTFAFLSFIIIFVVARISGASVTGDYAFAVATASMVSLLATLGLDQIAVRMIGGDLREGRRDLALAALFAVARTIAPVALALALILMVASPYAALVGASMEAMMAVSVSVVAFPLLRLAVVTLRATGKILISQFLDGAHSVTMLVGLGGMILVGDGTLSAALTAALYSTGIVFSAIIAWALLYREIRDWPRGVKFEGRLLASSWPILIAAFCHSFTQWIVLAQLGAEFGSAQVGAYRVANQVVMIIALMLTTIESLVNPQLAGDFRIGDIQGAWRRHRRASALMLVAAFFPVLLCLIAPHHILGLFGPEFGIATVALMIMSAGQIVNVLTGPIGGMMIMSGRERISLWLSIAGLITAVLLSVALIPVYGLVGAAIAGASATILRNIAAYIFMRRVLKVTGVD